jgi:hypothetical protein
MGMGVVFENLYFWFKNTKTLGSFGLVVRSENILMR